MTALRRRAYRALPVVVWFVGMACGADTAATPTSTVGTDPSPPVPPLPAIHASTVAGNSQNVLSVLVTARVQFADSVGVRYGLAGASLNGAAPAVRSLGDSAVVSVLGLLPDTRYSLQVVAYGADQMVRGDTLDFTTGALPADLPQYTADGPDPAPGYVVFAAGKYGLVIDNTGRVVWYRRFPDGAGLNFQPQPTGRYAAHPPTPDPTDREPWVEIDPLGNITRTLDCAGGLTSRLHDLMAAADGSYWLMCDETRPMDLSGAGGVVNAKITGTVVQHVSAAGALLFQWSPFDHFAITDLDPADRAGANVNWTHGNALDFDSGGGLIVSFRSLNEVTKIDTSTGAVVWRLGGLHNQFDFLDSPIPPFTHQHGMRVIGLGLLELLDNLGNPSGSRAERYAYEERSHTARLVASYGPDPTVLAQLGGTTQYLPGGHALVSFGTAGRVEEYDATGAMVWQIDGNPGYVFRAQRIRSLYAPGVGLPR